MRNVLRLYLQNSIIQNNSHPRQNCKSVYCSLKNMSLHGIAAMEIQNATTSTTFLKKGEYLENEKFLLSLSDIKVYFFLELKAFLAKLFSKRLSVSKDIPL